MRGVNGDREAGGGLKWVETELSEARGAAAAAREEAAQLRGQSEALQAQHAELMRVIQDRRGRSARFEGWEERNRYLDTYH